MISQFQTVADFIAIYILEAHPIDEWLLYTHVCWKQPTTIQERNKIANLFREQHNYHHPLFLDNMQNSVEDVFAAWPERLYIVEKNKIVYVGGIGPFQYHPNEVDEWLHKRFPDK